MPIALQFAWAAPKLGLSSNFVALPAAPVGTNVTDLTIEAFNTGDGALSLTITGQSEVDWVSGTMSALRPCSFDASSPCIPLRFAFKTAGLARGTYNARFRISDPNAIDSPVIVTLSVRMGLDPVEVDRFMPPGATISIPIAFSGPAVKPTVDSGDPWLSILATQVGKPPTQTVYSISLSPPAGMSPGVYAGKISAGAEAIPVTMRLTNDPIAAPSPDHIDLRLAGGGPPVSRQFLPSITFSNSGLSPLEVSDASTNCPGLRAEHVGQKVMITARPRNLPLGTCDGAIVVQCNAANCPLEVPVHFEVVPPAAPEIPFRGVSAGSDVTPGGVAVIKGQQFSAQPPQVALPPLPTVLGSTQVLVDGVAAPLYYTSSGQIGLQIPSDTPLGAAFVQVVRDGQPGNTVSTNVVPIAPRIIAISDSNRCPVNSANPAAAGGTIILWGTGMGPTDPAVLDGQGAPADPPALLIQVPAAQFYGGSIPAVTPSFAGLEPGHAGLYKIVVQVPAGYPKGNGAVILSFPNALTNTVFFPVR